ncbi:MAG: TolC family protein [candidate division Zixibacteria bacterium]|nr:TolC family protein [candidate division Zixibacteria bacterium]
MLKVIYLWMIIMIMPITNSISLAGEIDNVLDSLVQIALEKNPDIVAAETDYQAAQYNRKASGWLPDPTISITGSNLPHRSLSLDQTPMSGVSIGFSQKIPWPGKLSKIKNIAGLNAQNKKISISAWKNRVTREVKSAYFDFAYWSLTEAIIDENILMMKSLTEIAQTKYANGKGLAQDVLSIQTSLSKAEDKKIGAATKKKAALAKLNQLTNKPVYQFIDITAKLPPIDTISKQLERLIDEAILINPRLGQSSNKVKQADEKRALAKNRYWPDIYLGAEYRIREDIPMDAVDGEDFISARVGLSIPLWFFKNQSNQYSSSVKALSAARKSKESVKQQIEYGITTVFLETDRYRQGFRLYDETVIPQAEAALESANIAYQVGKVDFLNLLTAQLRLFELQIERLGMLRDYNKSLAALDEIVGVSYGGN